MYNAVYFIRVLRTPVNFGIKLLLLSDELWMGDDRDKFLFYDFSSDLHATGNHPILWKQVEKMSRSVLFFPYQHFPATCNTSNKSKHLSEDLFWSSSLMSSYEIKWSIPKCMSKKKVQPKTVFINTTIEVSGKCSYRMGIFFTKFALMKVSKILHQKSNKTIPKTPTLPLSQFIFSQISNPTHLLRLCILHTETFLNPLLDRPA